VKAKMQVQERIHKQNNQPTNNAMALKHGETLKNCSQFFVEINSYLTQDMSSWNITYDISL